MKIRKQNTYSKINKKIQNLKVELEKNASDKCYLFWLRIWCNNELPRSQSKNDSWSIICPPQKQLKAQSF